MAQDRLHVICGNCGCDDMFEYRILKNADDIDGEPQPGVYITCNNCDTIHNLGKKAILNKKKSDTVL